jgi:hypothetical protein
MMIAGMRRYFVAHKTTWLVLALVVPVIIALVTVLAASRADARICTHNPDSTCRWSPPKTAREFRHGYYDRAHGVNLGNYFKHPLRSRAVFVRKAHRRIAHMSLAHRRLVADFVNARVQSKSGDSPDQCQVSDWWCLARASVLTVVHGANCRGGQYYSVLVKTCVAPAPAEHFMTVKQTIAVGGVFFCGGSVVIGAIASPASGGTTALVAGWGGTSCMFSAWAALQ